MFDSAGAQGRERGAPRSRPKAVSVGAPIPGGPRCTNWYGALDAQGRAWPGHSGRVEVLPDTGLLCGFYLVCAGPPQVALASAHLSGKQVALNVMG